MDYKDKDYEPFHTALGSGIRYRHQAERWLKPDDGEHAQNWRRFLVALGFPADAAYVDVVEEIRRWRAWADVVRIGVMTAIPDRELPEVSDPEW
jgi:hypothetical protein